MNKHKTTNLYEGLKEMKKAEILPWDDYFCSMAEADLALGRENVFAAKSYFIRKAPFAGNYALFGGITAALLQIERTRFDTPKFADTLRQIGYPKHFINVLQKRKHLKVQIYAPQEGAVFFPNEPILTACGPLLDVRLIEGIFTKELNFASLSLTKWNRLVRATRPSALLEFGRRRAQNAQDSSLYAMLAGCRYTSNADMAAYFDMPITGTMGHEWVQSVGEPGKAFDLWIRTKPHKPVGLVDTKQTLTCDFPQWLDAVHRQQEKIVSANAPLWGWRNDSGDLAELAIEQYRRYLRHPISKNPWFSGKMRIFLTDQIDEHKAARILDQIRKEAPRKGIDPQEITSRLIWGAGTNPATCNDQPSLDGVLKLVQLGNAPCIKLNFGPDGNPGPKTSIPGFNRSALIFDREGLPVTALVYNHNTHDIKNGKLRQKASGTIIKDLKAIKMSTNVTRSTTLKDYNAKPQQALIYDTLTTNPRNNWKKEDIRQIPQRIEESLDAMPALCTKPGKNQHSEPPGILLTRELNDLRLKMIEKGQLQQGDI